MKKYTVTEVYSNNNGKNIYGELYKPDSKEKLPLIIFAHELGNTHESGTRYAEHLVEEGYAIYMFDFCGGGFDSRSDGETTEMSVMTEVTDLEAVMENAKTWDFIDENRIIVIGGSQGGIVSAIAAARHPDDLQALILLYPAFVVHDQVHLDFKTYEDIPEQYDIFNWMPVGGIYARDMWDYDVYSEIGNYTKPVLLLHGDADYTVPISYSQRAVEVYHDAEYHVIAGGSHEFFNKAFDDAINYIDDFLSRIQTDSGTSVNVLEN